MKAFLSFLFCMGGLLTSACAQSIDPLNIDSLGLDLNTIVSQMQLNTDTNAESEGGELSKIEFFKTFWEDRAVKNDSPNINMFAQYYQAILTSVSARQTQNCGTGYFQGNWRCVGPDNLPTPSIGYVNCVWADPDNSSHILAGTWGGLFESRDGGVFWKNITDGAPIVGGVIYVSWIAVNPLRKSTIYLGTSAAAGLTGPSSNGHGAAILKSFDGGDTWEQEIIPISNDGYDYTREFQKIFFTPDSTRIYAFQGDHVYTRLNDGNFYWEDITPANISTHSKWFNLQFVPGNQSRFFICNTIKDDVPHAGIWESNVAVPQTTDWVKITDNFSDTLRDYSSPSDYRVPNDQEWVAFDISIPNSDKLYAIAMSVHTKGFSENHWAGLYSYDLGILTSGMTRINNSIPLGGNPTHAKFELAVSNASTSNNNNNANIYFGSSVAFQSYDGGLTFHQLHLYDGATCHADIRGVYIQKATNSLHGEDDVVFFATDGGVSEKPANTDVSITGTNSLLNINGTGLTCGHFWSVATSEEGGLLLGGMMHDGIVGYEPKQTPQWHRLESGDSYTCAFDKDDRTEGYALRGFPDISRYVSVPGSGRLMNTVATDVYPPEKGGELAPPMDVDNSNTHFTGITSFWNKSNSGSWTTISGTPTGTGIHTFTLNPNASSFAGYILTGINASTKIQNLYYRNPPTTPNFVTIAMPGGGSPPAYPKSCVIMDPDVPESVWIGLGGTNYAPDGFNRVYYSPDAGANWYDISIGLPNSVPVSKLAFYKGINQLYCATDVGVYSCDFSTFNASSNTTVNGSTHNTSVEWKCFNKGITGGPDFPNCYVTDLKINYCQGKLYASTYGRSIWSTDIVQNTDVVGTATTIDAYTHWTSDKYLTGSVLVTSGNTLEITGSTTTIHMAKNSMITVEPGAHLIVTDATITNSCESCMWLGIEATGNAALPQTGSNQGKVTLTNATIEHARNAVMNWGSYSGLGGASCGGIIQASNTLFHNCRRSVAFNQYYYGTIKNASSFVKCNFIIDEGYKGDSNSPFEEQVALYNTNGVKFYGCEFYNRLTNAQKGLGIAIHIAGGGGEVHDESFSGGSPVHCKFTGFKFGVFAEAAAIPNYKTLIDGAVFDSCGIGIRGLNDNGIVAMNNNFYVGHGTFAEINNTDCYKNIGIFLTACPNAIVEENTATGVTPGNSQSGFERMGIVVSNSGSSDKDVYRNTLTGLEFGVLALDQNSAGLIGAPSPGLHVLCNSFQNNIKDIYAAVDPSQLAYGLGYFQGSPSISAGNQFLTSTTSPVNINNYAHFIEYFYNGTQPSYVGSSSPLGGIWFQTATANTCPARYGGGGYPNTSTGKAAASSAYFTAAAQKASLESDYAALVDGGDYNLLQAYVDGYTIEDSTTVYDSLSNMSPWLSREILVHVADAGVLPSNMMKDILINNPEMVDLDLIDHVGTSGSIPYPLNSGEQAEVEDAMGTATARSDMNSEIALQASDMRYFTNVMLTNLMIDSMGTEADSIPVWYDRMNTVEAEYNKIGFYVGIGDYTTAENLISNLPNKFSLTTQETNELDLYTQFYDILKNIHDDGRSIMEITEAELADIQSIQDNATTINARQIIIDTKGITEAPNPNAKQICPYLLVLSSEGKPGPEQGQMNAKRNIQRKPALADKVNAYPNPAKDYILFTYNVKKTSGGLHITIANEMGKIVADIPLVRKAGTYNLNTDKFPSGLYIYKLLDLNKTVDIGKVVIVK